MGDSFGQLFRIMSFGESHGPGLGVVIEGCPAGIPIGAPDIQAELDRRRPGQSKLVTPRKEKDQVEILSGIFEGHTLGTAIGLLIRNADVDSSKYEDFKDKYRPSHADYTYDAKYGRRDWRGGGRASARETAARVAAGAVAKRVLSTRCPEICVVGWVAQVADVTAAVDPSSVTPDAVDAHPTRCPDAKAAADMETAIQEARKARDTVGGVVSCVVRGVPAGWGEPVFDKLEADLAKAMLSIPAAKGVEVGSGFAGTLLRGSQHNDPFVMSDGEVRTTSNHSGGIQGGISNGEDIFLRVAFKPVATIFQSQDTVTSDGRATTISPKGRHDPCVLPRAVPIVEAMVSLVLCDHMLRQRARQP
jgi:chorismate synthase